MPFPLSDFAVQGSAQPMFASASVFLDFNLPNATTWFYFSLLLAIALFFKFSRLLSVRNWDVVFLFLLTPGLLLIHHSRPGATPVRQQPAVKIAGLVAAQSGDQLGLARQLAPVTALVADREFT